MTMDGAMDAPTAADRVFVSADAADDFVRRLLIAQECTAQLRGNRASPLCRTGMMDAQNSSSETVNL